MTTEKSDPSPNAPTAAADEPQAPAPKELTGVHYLSRPENGSERMTSELKATFAGAMEKGFVVGRRLQLMFALRDAVVALRSVTVPPPSGAVEIEQADPVLHLLDEAGDAAKEFIEGCGPLVDLLPQLGPVFEKLDKLEAFLKANRVIVLKRTSLTEQQLVGFAVARMEEVLGGNVRMQPKEMEEFFNDIDLFDGAGPDAADWKEILGKMRLRTDDAGNRVPHKDRGRLLDAFELAVKNRAKKDGGQ